MDRIDNWFELKFTKLLHWIQRFAGFTSFRVSHQLAIIIVMDGFCQIADYWLDGVYAEKTEGVIVFFCAFCCLIWGATAWFCDRFDRKFNQNPKSIPFLLNTPSAFRLAILLMTILAVVFPIKSYFTSTAGYLEFLNAMGSICMWAFYYTASIPPLPPGESKVRSWLKSFRSAPVMRPAESAA